MKTKNDNIPMFWQVLTCIPEINSWYLVELLINKCVHSEIIRTHLLVVVKISQSGSTFLKSNLKKRLNKFPNNTSWHKRKNEKFCLYYEQWREA